MLASIRRVLTPTAVVQLLVGWLGFVALTLVRPIIQGSLTTPLLFSLLAGIVAVIILCAFGVVTQAERLAHRLGEPYGTLVLTLSIVIIEVILISAVMLGPGDQPTIARDSVMAVAMIIMNLVIGIALLVAGLRQAAVRVNPTGASAYVAVLSLLLVVAFALPQVVGLDGSYSPGQAVVVLTLALMLYGFFLYRQMGAQREHFQEVGDSSAAPTTSSADQISVMQVLREHRTEILTRAAVLVLTVIPIVLLSHDMAALLDQGLERLGAPIALSGLLIAAIVFLPETITAIRAALQGEMQRVSNLSHGALVSTVGLTIPAVLSIGLLTGQPVVLAASAAELMLLAVTIVITMASFLGKRATALHGAVHVMMFGVYLLVVFA